MRSRLLLGALLLAGCRASPMNDRALYDKELAAAQAEPAPSARALAAGDARFKALYADFSTVNLRKLTREVYARDAFFADPLRQVQGIDAVDAYFLSAAESIEGWKLVFEGEAGGRDRYYRWTMEYVLRYNGRRTRFLGMSHVIYDAEGKVRFHQDYYDGAEAVYEKLPVLGWLIRRVRSRI